MSKLITSDDSPLSHLRGQLAAGESDPPRVAAESLSLANNNSAKNVYLALDPERMMNDATLLAESGGELMNTAPRVEWPSLFAVPVSLKDCFELRGYPTSCGSRFYAERNGIASADSAVAEVLRQQGAIIVGKTHLHQLAYGITGENADYGDCSQPFHPERLTGGSSSGGAASVQEGSVIAAIGTDTGGSIRVPAALCGLAGYRSSHGTKLRSTRSQTGYEEKDVVYTEAWKGGAHLAPSFDTIGWLFRDLRDGPALAHALFELEATSSMASSTVNDGPRRIGAVGRDFTHDCQPSSLEVFDAWKERVALAGAQVDIMSEGQIAFWSNSFEIFAGIQAHEASILHRGNFAHFQPDIAERLAWGASLSADTLSKFHARLASFQVEMRRLLISYNYLLVPCAPVSSLRIGADHSDARRRILRYTTPMSLGGNPVVALPGKGGGVQLVGCKGDDAGLLDYAARLANEMFATSAAN